MRSRRSKKLVLDRSTVKRLTGPALARANGGYRDPLVSWARSDLRYCIEDSAECVPLVTDDCTDTLTWGWC